MKRNTFSLSLPAEPLREKLRAFVARFLPQPAPEVLLAGRVCDGEGEPVAFARVEAGGTPYNTETNAAGYFVLHVPERQLHHALSLFVFASGFVRFERRLEAAPAGIMECTLQREHLAKVVSLYGNAGKGR